MLASGRTFAEAFIICSLESLRLGFAWTPEFPAVLSIVGVLENLTTLVLEDSANLVPFLLGTSPPRCLLNYTVH